MSQPPFANLDSAPEFDLSLTTFQLTFIKTKWSIFLNYFEFSQLEYCNSEIPRNLQISLSYSAVSNGLQDKNHFQPVSLLSFFLYIGDCQGTTRVISSQKIYIVNIELDTTKISVMPLIYYFVDIKHLFLKGCELWYC